MLNGIYKSNTTIILYVSYLNAINWVFGLMHSFGTIILSSQSLIWPTSTFGMWGGYRIDYFWQLFSIFSRRSLVMGNLKPHEDNLATYHYLPLAKIWMPFNFTQNKNIKIKTTREIEHLSCARCCLYSIPRTQRLMRHRTHPKKSDIIR